jgi:signal transduction histidine kinase
MLTNQVSKISSSFINILLIFIASLVVIISTSYLFFQKTEVMFDSFMTEEMSLLEDGEEIHKDIMMLKTEVFIFALERANTVSRQTKNKKLSTKIIKSLRLLKKRAQKLNDKKLEDTIVVLINQFSNFYTLSYDIAKDFESSYEDGIDTLGAVENLLTILDDRFDDFTNRVLKRIDKKNIEIKESIKLAMEIMAIIAIVAIGIALLIYRRGGQIKQIAKSLNDIIIKRTEEIEEQKDELEQTIENLKKTQNQLVESEKMAALGQLIAGVAHEINTPIGAIKSSGENIYETILSSFKMTIDTFKNLTDEDEALFLDMLATSQNREVILTTRDERKIRKELKSTLEEIGIEDTQTIAKSLIRLKIYNNLDRYKSLLLSSHVDEIFKSADMIADIINNTKNINLAVARVTKIVFALKSFARAGNSDKKILSNIRKNMETVLTIYHNQIKMGIELNTEYDEVEDIYYYEDELAQVWTNIIHNALQAMEHKGSLDIKIKDEEKNQVVYIKDSGGGIPKEIQDKIFDPFFTTKKAGEGSGIGLDIVKKIVESHDGTITFEVEEGVGTTFIISIPKVFSI